MEYQILVGENLATSVEANRFPCRNLWTSLIFVLTLSMSLKHVLNALRNSSMLPSKKDSFSNNGAKHANIVPITSVPTDPT